ncbi:MAG: protein phosphatase 2C domain-containing protein [Candidatus Schekmanbacteria bacterium]|nr:protein phosphatase 2C domain-containing protein [Candidatus Schekmanbacteria bacterium]
MKVRFATRTHPGKIRRRNEDALFADREIGFALVADGVGGHNSGNLASQLVVDAVCEELREEAGSSDDEIKATLARALELANYSVRTVALANPDIHRGMGSTATLLLLRNGKYYIANVGDSRTYRISKSGIEQLTRDHSFVQEQVALGVLTAEQAQHHQLKNCLTRAIGNKETVDIDLFSGNTSPGDVFLLASDGLTNSLDGKALLEVISETPDLDAAVNELVLRANDEDGSDNISAVLAQVDREAIPVPVALGSEAEAAQEPDLSIWSRPQPERAAASAPVAAPPVPAARTGDGLLWKIAAMLLLAAIGIFAVRAYLTPPESPSPREVRPTEVAAASPRGVAQVFTPVAPAAAASAPAAAATEAPAQPTPTATAVPTLTQAPTPPPPPTSPPTALPLPTAPAARGADAAPQASAAVLAAHKSGITALQAGLLTEACTAFVGMARESGAAYSLQLEANKQAGSTLSTLHIGSGHLVYFVWRKGFFYVYAGLYPDAMAATAGISSLPDSLKRNKPVVRSIASILADASCESAAGTAGR